MAQKNTAFLMLALLLVGTVVLAGCTQPDNGTTGPNGAGGRNFGNRAYGNRTFNGTRGAGGFGPNGFGNMTDAQRQERSLQRRSALLKACEGKTENDACTLMGRDNRNGSDTNLALNGTCHALNGTLQCWPSFQERGGFGGSDTRQTPTAAPTTDGYGQLPQ